MKQQQMQAIQQKMMQGQQMLQMAQQAPPQNGGGPPSAGQSSPGGPQSNPQAEQIQKMMEQGQLELQKIQEKPTIEQVLRFLQDNRSVAFTLDIETDSTIQADEQMEKQQTNEFIQVLGPILAQLSQMIVADPGTAPFCGEVIKFATKPYRAGRQLDGAIDELVEQMKAKGSQPKGDDPLTAKGKLDMQVEQMKQDTEKKKLEQDAALKTQEMEQKDRHKTWELNNQKNIERMKLEAKQGDAEGKLAVQAQKSASEHEKAQMDMLGKQEDLRIKRELGAMKAAEAQQMSQARQADFANRSNERQMAHQQKLQQGVLGGKV
jgi:hypothetical protein